MRWGMDTWQRSEWYPTREEAEVALASLLTAGRWSGKAPRIEVGGKVVDEELSDASTLQVVIDFLDDALDDACMARNKLSTNSDLRKKTKVARDMCDDAILALEETAMTITEMLEKYRVDTAHSE